MTRASANLPPRLHDYEALRPIGGGGYGEVWLARNALGGFCALKIVRRAAFEDARPYEREFAGIQKYEPISRSHPNLVHVLHVGRDDSAEFFYYVMELADDMLASPANGSDANSTAFRPDSYSPRTLKQEVRARRRFPAAPCVQIGLALAGALRHLHERGLVHRDVKPSNVIYIKGVPKLADIGLVAEAGEAISFVGTEGFIPPEGPGSPQADVYSLGKLLYEISTGKDRNEYPEPLTELGSLPDRAELLELNAVIHRACQPRAKDRYASAQEIESDLRELQSGKSIRARQGRRIRVARAGKILAGAAGAGLLIFAALKGDRFGKSSAPKEAIAWVREAESRSPTTREGFEQALELCHRAIELAPDYAPAFVVLANAYREAAGWHRPERQAMIEARQAALRALQLDERNAGAWIQLGLVQMLHDWDFAEAEASFKRGLALNRRDAWHLTAYADLLRSLGRTEESRALVEEAIDLGRNGQTFGSINHLTDYALQLYAERNFDAMIEQCRVMREARPGLILPMIYNGLAQAGRGNCRQALKDFQAARAQEDAPDLMALAAYCHGRLGETNEAQALLKRLDDFAPVMEVSPYYRAYVFAGLGDTNAVFAQLEAAYAHRSGHLVGYSWRGLLKDAIWQPFHRDPRWADLARRVGLPAN